MGTHVIFLTPRASKHLTLILPLLVLMGPFGFYGFNWMGGHVFGVATQDTFREMVWSSISPRNTL